MATKPRISPPDARERKEFVLLLLALIGVAAFALLSGERLIYWMHPELNSAAPNGGIK